MFVVVLVAKVQNVFEICKKNRPERRFFYLVSVLKLLLLFLTYAKKLQNRLCINATMQEFVKIHTRAYVSF